MPLSVARQAAVAGHEFSARDDITLKIVTVWLPGPRATEAPVPHSQRVIGDSPPHASAFVTQLSMSVMNVPMIELDTVGFLISFGNSRDHRRADQHAASLWTWEVEW